MIPHTAIISHQRDNSSRVGIIQQTPTINITLLLHDSCILHAVIGALQCTRYSATGHGWFLASGATSLAVGDIIAVCDGSTVSSCRKLAH